MNALELFDKLRDMLSNHPFWATLTLAVLAWYSSITIYVGIRGALDIKHMLRKPAAQDGEAEEHA